MSRNEMYPWSTLERVGDYFIVLHEFKPYEHMNATISIRNRNMQGRIKYSCTKTTYGCIVMVAQVLDHLPEHEVEIVPGLYARTTNVGPSPVTLGNKPPVRELTQAERVAQMSASVRVANLPWWHDPKTGMLVVSSTLLQEPEASLWYKKQFNPKPNDPYPAHYHLDQNLMRRNPVEQTEEDEEGWGDQTFQPGEDDVSLDDA